MNTMFCLKNRLYACLKKCAYNVLYLPFIINANAPANAQSVLKRLTDSIEYRADWTYNISDASERTPFWLSSNRYGLGGVRHSNGHMRWGVFKNEKRIPMQHGAWDMARTSCWRTITRVIFLCNSCIWIWDIKTL